MNCLISPQSLNLALFLASLSTAAMPTKVAGEPLKQGDVIQLNGRAIRVHELESLPYVESEFTKRFRFDSFDNPKLKELRDQHRLDEFER